MKKFNYFLLGAAGLLLASCANDDLESLAPKGDGNVNITVSLPGDLATRGDVEYGDGLQAKILQYAVYEEGTNKLVLQSQTTFPANSLETTVSLNLVTGKNYNIAFFALSDAATGIYTFNANPDEGDPSIDINYSAMTSAGNMADDYDCFYAFKQLGEVNANINMDVDLIRPVAQINWGTDDLGTADQYKEVVQAYGTNGAYITTTLQAQAYEKFDLFTSDVTGDPVTVTLGENGAWAAPSTEGYMVKETYEGIAMQYLFVPSTSSVLDLELNITNGKAPEGTTAASQTITVNAAPVQANYQTNIYGTLLSNAATFNVEKVAAWGGQYNFPIVWDGKTVSVPDISSGTVETGNPAVIAGIAKLVNEGEDLSNVTVKLTDDIDMGGYEFPMIGSGKRSSGNVSGNSFKGVFDGNNKTISNIKITGTTNADDAAGIFPSVDGADAVIKNVTFENIQISAPDNEQAGVVGILSGGATVTGVTVKSGSITSSEGAGGIVGRVLKSGTISNCDNYADISVSKYNAGGIAGAAYYSETGSCAITISYCNNYGNVTGVSSGTGQTIGGIVGICAANIISCTNNGNVGDSTTNSPAGGIVGYMNSCGSIKNCTNNGKVTGSSQVAGILAFLGGITYDYTEVIEISGNTNKGELVGSGTVGGILGINRNGCTLQDNTNDASSMTGSSVAGIVGNAMKSGNIGDGYVHLVSDNNNLTALENMHGAKVAEIYTGTLYIGEQLSTNNP